VVVRKTLKNVLLVGLVVVVPGAAIAWLIKLANTDPDKEDFRQYVEQNFERLKTEEQQWLQ
jgi:hypothetical protein